jgi:hypothetical protein
MQRSSLSHLQNAYGRSTELSFCEKIDVLADAIDEREIDAVIVGCETGFSEFGYHAGDLAGRLGVDVQFMRKQAEWNRFDNDRISILSFSGPEGANLRSLVLLPYGGAEPGWGCRSYRPFEGDFPNCDFYYNMAHEAL